MERRGLPSADDGKRTGSDESRSRRRFSDAGAYRDFLASHYASDPEVRELTVSVVMAAYNPPHDRMLSAIRSVLASTHAALEVIVIDDGSDVPVADWLRAAEPDPRISIFRQKNAGLGMARNAGIDAATGEFVFFIDDDDRVRPEAIALLVAHAHAFGANVVVGTRYLVDERGRVLSISIQYLPGSSYRVYQGRFDYPFTDQMAHGRVIRRRFLLESGVRFETGAYEDRLFSTRLYLAGPTHFANIPTYEWTQYASRSTVSSVMSVARLHDKLRSLEACWAIMPRHLRYRFMREVLALDLARFIQAWPSADDDYRAALVEWVGAFLRDRSAYLWSLHRGSFREHARALEKGDWNALSRLYPVEADTAERDVLLPNGTRTTHEPMDDYFCHTHYHVLFSLLLAAERKRPAQIFIYTGYQHFSPRFLEALRATPWVHKVVTYAMGRIVETIDARLRSDPTTADIWLPHLMRNEFASLIDAIDERDNCFTFNDTLPSWYVIENAFQAITRVEDAYGSMRRELQIHHTYGRWDRVLARLGHVFPSTIYQSSKITEIIVGTSPSDVPDALAPLLRVFDPLAAIRTHEDALREFCTRAYEGSSLRFGSSTVLIYTQPLAHIGYCSRFEQREMYRGIISAYNARDCVIKPHPADTVDYSPLGVAVIDRNMPSEALNLMAASTEIDLALSFSSSAATTTQFARRQVRLVGDDLTVPAEIHKAIISLIPDHGSLRFRRADSAWTFRHSLRMGTRVDGFRKVIQKPHLILVWLAWKLRRVLDIARRRLPV